MQLSNTTNLSSLPHPLTPNPSSPIIIVTTITSKANKEYQYPPEQPLKSQILRAARPPPTVPRHIPRLRTLH